MRSFKEIRSEGGVTVDNLILEAYTAGLQDGRAEMTEKYEGILSNVTNVIENIKKDIMGHAVSPVAPNTPSEDVEQKTAEPIAGAQGIVRAAPGTVKPGILAAISESPFGLTTEEIIEKTGFKPNSVRGTLWTLQDEKAIGKIDDRWMSAEEILKAGFAASTENPGASGAGAV